MYCLGPDFQNEERDNKKGCPVEDSPNNALIQLFLKYYITIITVLELV